MLENLKDYNEFFSKLLEDKMLYGAVGFNEKDKVNYVLIKYDEEIRLAGMRFEKRGDGLRYAIYPLEGDYVQDVAPFSCMGSYNEKTGEVKIERMTFALDNSTRAGISPDDLTDENVVWSIANTGKYIPAEIKEKLEAEYDESVKDGQSLAFFLEKYSQYFDGNPLSFNQTHYFKEDPMKFVKNFEQGYNIVEDMLYHNYSFTKNKFDMEENMPTYDAALNGVQICYALGLDEVRTETTVTRNDLLTNLPMQVPYDSCYRSCINAKTNDGRCSVSGVLEHLNIRYFDAKTQMGYNFVDAVPEFYDIDYAGNIKGKIDSTNQEKFEAYVDIVNLNKDIIEKAFNIITGKDNDKDDLEDDLEM